MRETFVPSTVMARENSWDLGGDGVDDIDTSFLVSGVVVGVWWARGLASTRVVVRPSQVQVRAGIMGMMVYRMAGTIPRWMVGVRFLGTVGMVWGGKARFRRRRSRSEENEIGMYGKFFLKVG